MLCSTAIINIFSFSVRGSTLDVRILSEYQATKQIGSYFLFTLSAESCVSLSLVILYTIFL